MCSSLLAPRGPVCAYSPDKFNLLFFPLGSTILKNLRILSGILNVYSKTKIESGGEKEVFL